MLYRLALSVESFIYLYLAFSRRVHAPSGPGLP
jgi:hypothetical protein